MPQDIIKILINGASGKMGQISKQAIAQDPQLDCVACCSRTDDLSQSIQQAKPDIVIDFTNANAVFANTKIILSHKVKALIGSSGLEQSEIQDIRQYCMQHKLGAMLVPNFSLTAILMMRYATDAAKYFDNVAISELHHISKVDAPSGTALHTAQQMYQRNPKLRHQLNDQAGLTIHSHRSPQQHAVQQVDLHTSHESLHIKSHCFDRQSYIKGIQLACHALSNLHSFQLGLGSILEDL
jgi:4-hydroxy-tetrahydrodipicolinate reductase